MMIRGGGPVGASGYYRSQLNLIQEKQASKQALGALLDIAKPFVQRDSKLCEVLEGGGKLR